MRELRIGTWIAALALLTSLGCDDNGDGGPDDAGMMRLDSGGGGDDTDSGTMTPEDSGMTTPPDSGGGDSGPSCGFEGECDLLDSTTCDDGQACVLRVETQGGPAFPFCVPSGIGTDGAACDSSSGQCAEGFDCSPFESVCRRNCCRDADCNPPGAITGQVCRLFGNAGPEGSLAGICALPDACNPADGSGCEGGQACYIGGPDAHICLPPGTIGAGEACGGDLGRCIPGYGCLDGTCLKLCDLTAGGAGCPDGMACNGRISFEDGGDPLEDVGFCVDAS